MADFILILSIFSIWIAVFESIVIMAGAIRFINKQDKKGIQIPEDMDHYPTVTVMVPAHNEGKVIVATVEHILRLNYPEDKVQVIVIADNCTDDTAEKLRSFLSQTSYLHRNVTVMERKGTGGKSGALNDGLEIATGDWICIFDADAAPERNSLMFLAQKSLENPEQYGVVFGRNKARNRGQNFLSKCINLEIITSQRVYHTGLWELFQLGSIPGTNYIIKTKLIREIGGWDVTAITEDTALSFEILNRGQFVALAPQAEAYQQEPEQLSVYMKQRERWAKGNYQVVLDNIHNLFNRSSWRNKLLVIYYAVSYFWFMLAIIVSDIIFLVNLVYRVIAIFKPEVMSPFQFAGDAYVFLVIGWALMYFIYVLQINLALAADIGQSNTRNFIYACVSYFTYAQLFILISIKAFYSLIMDKIRKRESKWYKTERFG